jgi:CubicO group peptidase (beta-lactamase class C family)
MPPDAGESSARLAPVINLITERGCPAQICVIARGQIVLDRAFGCRPDDLFFLFSASKPVVALAVHMVAERGMLALDEPVARYWPAFGQRGKDAITVRQVLQHRSGLPVARSMVRDSLAMTSWPASVRAIEQARPAYLPGEVPAYHVLSYGFILGELVQRVTGASLRDFVHDELLDPLGLRDTYLGLPSEQWSRQVAVRGRGGAEFITQLMINRRATRQAVIPATSVSTTARDLARLYQAMLNGGELDGARVLCAESIRRATTPSSDGEIDRYLKLPVRWSEGFQLAGAREASARIGGGPGPMGALARRATFGHNGSYVCIGWADPERQIALGYVTALLATAARVRRTWPRSATPSWPPAANSSEHAARTGAAAARSPEPRRRSQADTGANRWRIPRTGSTPTMTVPCSPRGRSAARG